MLNFLIFTLSSLYSRSYRTSVKFTTLKSCSIQHSLLKRTDRFIERFRSWQKPQLRKSTYSPSPDRLLLAVGPDDLELPLEAVPAGKLEHAPGPEVVGAALLLKQAKEVLTLKTKDTCSSYMHDTFNSAYSNFETLSFNFKLIFETLSFDIKEFTQKLSKSKLELSLIRLWLII